MGLTHASNNFNCGSAATLLSGTMFLIQKVAFFALHINCLMAAVKEPEGLNMRPKYLYSSVILTVALSIRNYFFLVTRPALLNIIICVFFHVNL